VLPASVACARAACKYTNTLAYVARVFVFSTAESSFPSRRPSGALPFPPPPARLTAPPQRRPPARPRRAHPVPLRSAVCKRFRAPLPSEGEVRPPQRRKKTIYVALF
jgi:hypothetical protein